MTDEELAEIEQRAEQATAGPWVSFIEGRDHLSGEHFIRLGNGDDLYLVGAAEADYDFIAAARHDVPSLIAELRRLRLQLAR